MLSCFKPYAVRSTNRDAVTFGSVRSAALYGKMSISEMIQH